MSGDNQEEIDSWKASFLRAGVYPEKTQEPLEEQVLIDGIVAHQLLIVLSVLLIRRHTVSAEVVRLSVCLSHSQRGELVLFISLSGCMCSPAMVTFNAHVLIVIVGVMYGDRLQLTYARLAVYHFCASFSMATS